MNPICRPANMMTKECLTEKQTIQSMTIHGATSLFGIMLLKKKNIQKFANKDEGWPLAPGLNGMGFTCDPVGNSMARGWKKRFLNHMKE